MAKGASVSPIRLASNEQDEVVSDMVSLFEAQFATLPWMDRSGLLEQIFDYLMENARDCRSVDPAFALIVEELVVRVGSPDVSCSEQAHVYAASGSSAHRRQASLWLGQRRCGGGEQALPSGASLNCPRLA